MACGTPVLAFDVDGLRTTVGDGAAPLVEPFDVCAYADALGGLLADPERCAQMGRRGRQLATASGWEGLASAQEAVYASALDSLAAARWRWWRSRSSCA